MLGACEKNELPEITDPYDASKEAKVKFFFHVEGAPAAAFYLNDTKVTAIAPLTTGVNAGKPRGQGFGTIYPNNNYAEIPTGKFTMRVVDVDASTAAGKLVELTSKEVTLEPNTYYSAYFVGVPAVGTTAATYEIHVAKDNQPPLDYDKVWWRFAHTMAGTPPGFKVDAYAVKAKIAATATKPEVPAVIIPLGMNLEFKQQGDYVQLPVVGTYDFKVYQSGTVYNPETSTPFISHSLGITSSHFGRVYTTQIRGTYSATVKTGKIDYWRER
jgi:hypothetical protein